MTGSWLRMDLSPLSSRDFRVLFSSSTITLLGTEATDVALVVQVKQLTGSTLAVGLLGAADLADLAAMTLCGSKPSPMPCGAAWPVSSCSATPWGRLRANRGRARWPA